MNDKPATADLRATMHEAIENDLRLAVGLLKDPPYRKMSEMIEYHLGWHKTSPEARGKRFRPLLTLLCCQAAGGDWRSALPAASCLELIHNFSLIHDDIQDSSDSRRGQPTMWKRWGMPQAINTGDAVFVLARLAALRLAETGISSDKIVQTLSIIDQECLNLTKGQYLDLEFERQEAVSQDDYVEMISGKTCALLRASAQCGALLGNTPPAALEHYRSFGHQLGIAFQIVDDILGIWGKSEVTGKSSEADLRDRKQTLPVIFGLKHSPRFHKSWSSGRSSSADVKNMKRALEDAGAGEHAQRLASEATVNALQALENAHPEASAAAELHNLASRLQTRTR